MMDKKKASLRQSYKKIRFSMPADEVGLKSRVICQKLIESLEWPNIKMICAYQPISGFNEVNISLLLTWLKDSCPQTTVHLISQVKNQKPPPEKFDLILVPTLAFDTDNYRLGWGGGFYDKFLAAQPEALKIGVGYQNGFCKDGLPHEPYDIPLDKIITEV